MLHLSPKTLQSIKNTFHVVFIAIIAFELLREVFSAIPDDWLFFFTSDAVENFVFAIIAYVLNFYVLKFQGIWKKIVFVILFSIILISLASLKDFRIHEIIDFEQSFEYFTSFLGQTLLFFSGIYLMNHLGFFNKYKKLEKELKKAKEQLLRNQLHPHFLFNAFNSLYSLSLKNHPDTSEYILKLSSMMRYLTDEAHLNTVPLKKEIYFIEQYIAIEKIRFGKDADIAITLKNVHNDSIFIAPFLLITLVENAFKHGFYTNSKEAFVNINVTVENNELFCVVENSVFEKQHFQENKREGKGLKNLKKRLNLLYPKHSNFMITSSENTYTTNLKIKLI